MPCTIVGAGLTILSIIIVCCCGRCGCGCMFWPLLTVLWGVVEIGVYVVSLYAYLLYFVGLGVGKNVYGVVLVGSVGWGLLVSLCVFFHSICRVMMPDARYRRWKKKCPICPWLRFLVFQSLTLLSYKFQHMHFLGIKSSPKL